ncbi:hypothetical protein AA13594_2638 [Gluconacetobacter azotocaptans DSM 13594]|nr:hypothetical protein AA13594_2638 [Gluconacetobacter azotocaptans DSM 13594]
MVETWKISQDERRIVGETLERLASRLPSQTYGIAQWRRDADAINYILSVYGEAAPPRYPLIDAMSLDVTSKDFGRLVAGLQAQDLQTPHGAEEAVFATPLRYAAILLDANDRDDAIHFPELWEKWNAQSLHAARHAYWRRYPYAAIIIPGEGPEDATLPLSALGKFRLTLAVETFRQGLAPFIIVSGGAVHPARTHYVEAEEMRRALIERFGIPERNIVMEPYARHTTTNLRNASRILNTLGAPDGMAALIVTDPDQSAYIEGPTFAERNQRELGCEPGTLGKRLSPFTIAFYPSLKCVETDPSDPLDP